MNREVFSAPRLLLLNIVLQQHVDRGNNPVGFGLSEENGCFSCVLLATVALIAAKSSGNILEFGNKTVTQIRYTKAILWETKIVQTSA